MRVDKELCEGHGQCEVIFPDAFQVDDEGKARLLSETVEPRHKSKLEEAALACPAEAITFVE
ncbi:MAG: ferredoxin [Pseudonocardia sp.]|nr:ferredoxin [Pseudonocardia sp.]